MKETVTIKGVRCTQITEGSYQGVYGPGFQIGVTKPGHCGHSHPIGECPYCWPSVPVVTEKHGESVARHPAFATINVNRAQGWTRLAGSDFRHRHSMVIEVREASLRRSLHDDRWHPGKVIAEVALSEGQWAAFVSSVGSGAGTPCTLLTREQQPVRRLADPPERTEQFKGELDEKLGAIRERVARLQKLVEEGGGKKALRDELHQLSMALGGNLDFVAQQFGEHMERTVEAAKTEIHAHMNAVVQAAGLQALGASAPLAPPGETDENRARRLPGGAMGGAS